MQYIPLRSPLACWRRACKNTNQPLRGSKGIKKKKNYVGREKSPYINEVKGDTLAQSSRESPPPQSYKTGNANWELKGYWKHPAPEPGCKKMGMGFASKFNGTLVVESQLFKLVKGQPKKDHALACQMRPTPTNHNVLHQTAHSINTLIYREGKPPHLHGYQCNAKNSNATMGIVLALYTSQVVFRKRVDG
eukprot:1156540-Pelagomonas_calceolata.AAC.2